MTSQTRSIKFDLMLLFNILGVLLVIPQARPIKLNVFGTESRYETLVISLRAPATLPTAEQLAPRVLGRHVFVNWPALHEAKVSV